MTYFPFKLDVAPDKNRHTTSKKFYQRCLDQIRQRGQALSYRFSYADINETDNTGDKFVMIILA